MSPSHFCSDKRRTAHGIRETDEECECDQPAVAKDMFG